MGDHGEGGGAVHQGQQADEDRDDDGGDDDAQGEPAEPPVPGGELGGAGHDDGEREEGHAPGAAHAGSSPGVRVSTRIGASTSSALEHRGAALRSHGLRVSGRGARRG